MKYLSLLLTLPGLAAAADCTYPMDVQFVFGYDGTANTAYISNSFPYFVNGLEAARAEMSRQCNVGMLVMNIRGTNKLIKDCVYAVTGDGWPHPGGWNGSGSQLEELAVAGPKIKKLTQKNYHQSKVPTVEILLYIGRTRWRGQRAQQRRIFFWTTSHMIWFGTTEFNLPTYDLKELYVYCPQMATTSTKAQFVKALESRGIAFFPLVVAAEAELEAGVRAEWQTFLTETGITDYYLTTAVRWTMMGKAAEMIKKGTLILASLGWTKSTTTAKPYGSLYDTEACLYDMRGGIENIISQGAEYREKVTACVFG